MNRARLLWLVLPAAGLIELGLHYWFANRAPTSGDWASLKEPVQRLKTGKELVVVAPRWAEPLARQALGDALMPLRDVARPEDGEYARAIEVSVLGQHASELASWRTASEERHGPFRIRIAENPSPEKVLYDFVDQLAPGRAEVAEVGADGPRACPWRENAPVSNGALGGNPTFPAKRFACGSGEWFFAGVTVIDDQNEYRARRCIWGHPTPVGPLRVRYRAVPVGRTVRGWGGMPWLIFRETKGPPVELEVRLDGQSLGTFVHRDEDGWAGFSFPTGREGGNADVEFEVRSSSTRDRHFCFSAQMR